MIRSFVDDLFTKIICNPEVKLCLVMNLNRSFPYYVERLTKKQKIKTACQLAARKLVHEALSLRKMHAGKFLKQVQNINSLEINNIDDFGECLHTSGTEPFFYETAYKRNFVQGQLTIDHAERSIISVDSISSQSSC